MATDHKLRISRRGFLAGLVSSPTALSVGGTAASQSKPTAPVDLGNGLEIRDYRLFPTKDAMRFIVEIYNRSDTAVDTPAVGVVIPELHEYSNYAWANPVSMVLHPQTSGCLIGAAPDTLTSDDGWGEPKWMLCSEILMKQAERLLEHEIEYSYTTEVLNPTHAKYTFEFTNLGAQPAQQLMIQGVIADSDGRVCGTSVGMNLKSVKPGESAKNAINIAHDLEYAANPFALIDDVHDIKVVFTVQPQSYGINPGCNIVVPWD